ncbi:MAG: ABC transporter substrate-binding protein [Candidatus Hydrothermarchaeota archaeon]
MYITRLTLIMIIVMLLLSGCISRVPERELPMRIGQLSGVANEEYFAIYNNYFEKEGLNITWVPFRGGSGVVQAAIANQIDGGVMGSVPAVIKAVSRGVPLKIVAVGALETKEHSGDRLVVLKKSGIKDIKDLKGKKIAVHRFGTTLDFIVRRVLKENGIDPVKDVTLVQVPVPQMVPVLQRGEVDAAFIFPYFYPYVKDNVTILITPGDVYPEGFPISVVFFREEFIQEHPEKVEKFVRAYLKGIEWGENNPDKLPDLVVKYTDIPREIATEIPWPANNPSGRVDSKTFDKIISDIKDYDPTLLEKNVTGEDLLDYRFLPT